MYSNVKRSQHNLKIIKRFDEDLWGRLALTNKPSRVLNYIFDSYQNNYKYRRLLNKRYFFLSKKRTKFLYKVISEEKEFRRKKRTMKINTYLNLLKLRRFYGNLGKKKIKRLFSQNRVHTNIMARSFAYFLESRLDVILYRANFFKSIFAARQYISHKKVFVNGRVTTKPSYKVFINDIVTVKNPINFYVDIKKRLQNREILVNYPSYLEVNYKVGSVILIKMPENKEVPFPFFMDLNNIAHNFFR